MAKFVKYTHRTQTSAGEKQSFVYINVDHVAKAVFNPETKELTLILTPGIPHAEQGSTAVLTGSEATDALEVIRSLA